MSIISSFIISLLAGMSTLIGSLIIFIKIDKQNISKFICFCLSFSIAIMVGVSLTELIPESFFYISYSNTTLHSFFIISLSFLIGFLLVKVIEKLIKEQDESLIKIGILSIIAIILHNIPEGIATFIGSLKSSELGIKLSLAIILHNIPEGISIVVPIYFSTKSRKKAIFYAFISGIAEPIGAIFAYVFLKNYISSFLISVILMIVAGIMITLSINEIYPKILQYNNKKHTYIGFALGIIIIIINHFILK